MDADLAFRFLLGALSLAGCGLFLVFLLMFREEHDVDPIYRFEACVNGDPESCTDERTHAAEVKERGLTAA